MRFSQAQRAEILSEMSKVIAEGNRYHVMPFRTRWMVVKSEGEPPTRWVVRSKAAALEQARELAIESRGEVIIHGRDGEVQERISFRDARASR